MHAFQASASPFCSSAVCLVSFLDYSSSFSLEPDFFSPSLFQSTVMICNFYSCIAAFFLIYFSELKPKTKTQLAQKESSKLFAQVADSSHINQRAVCLWIRHDKGVKPLHVGQ